MFNQKINELIITLPTNVLHPDTPCLKEYNVSNCSQGLLLSAEFSITLLVRWNLWNKHVWSKVGFVKALEARSGPCQWLTDFTIPSCKLLLSKPVSVASRHPPTCFDPCRNVLQTVPPLQGAVLPSSVIIDDKKIAATLSIVLPFYPKNKTKKTYFKQDNWNQCKKFILWLCRSAFSSRHHGATDSRQNKGFRTGSCTRKSKGQSTQNKLFKLLILWVWKTGNGHRTIMNNQPSESISGIDIFENLMSYILMFPWFRQPTSSTKSALPWCKLPLAMVLKPKSSSVRGEIWLAKRLTFFWVASYHSMQKDVIQSAMILNASCKYTLLVRVTSFHNLNELSELVEPSTWEHVQWEPSSWTWRGLSFTLHFNVKLTQIWTSKIFREHLQDSASTKQNSYLVRPEHTSHSCSNPHMPKMPNAQKNASQGDGEYVDIFMQQNFTLVTSRFQLSNT